MSSDIGAIFARFCNDIATKSCYLLPFRSDQVGLMCKEVVAVGVEQRGFDVVVQIFEQEVITALDEVESVGSFPAIDGVVACVKHDVLRIVVGVNNVARGATGDQHF